MEDSFQFIIESPQHAQGHKKRPRLVTSCDNCRLKKIKCLQPSPETKCEACKAAKIPCRFRDRERYFAERSRAIAGPNSSVYATELRSEPAPDPYSVASSSSSPSNLPRSSSQSPKASGMVSPDVDGSRYYTPDSRHHMGGSHTQSSSVSSFDSLRTGTGIPYNYANPVQSPTLLHYPANTRPYQHPQDIRSLQLYDPENPQRPHPSLMTHFIQVFFQKYGHDFTFLSYQDALGDFWEQRMSMVVANCIAAMAVRHSNLTDLSARDLHNISESYTDVAKHVLNSVAHIPSWDTMHGIMLLCWLENHQHRLPGFRTYYGMAVKMSQELGLQENLELHPTEYERNRARTTYAGLMQLHMTANSFRS